MNTWKLYTMVPAIRWTHKQKLHTVVQAYTKCLGSWGKSAVSHPGWRQERPGRVWNPGVRGHIHQESRRKGHSEWGNSKSSHAGVKGDGKFGTPGMVVITSRVCVPVTQWWEEGKQRRWEWKESLGCLGKCPHVSCVLINPFLEVHCSVCNGSQ